MLQPPNHLFSHIFPGWQRELQTAPFFLHLQTLVLHLPVQEHFRKPCPPPGASNLAASRIETSLSGISSGSKFSPSAFSNWSRCSMTLKYPARVPTLNAPEIGGLLQCCNCKALLSPSRGCSTTNPTRLRDVDLLRSTKGTGIKTVSPTFRLSSRSAPCFSSFLAWKLTLQYLLNHDSYNLLVLTSRHSITQPFTLLPVFTHRAQNGSSITFFQSGTTRRKGVALFAARNASMGLGFFVTHTAFRDSTWNLMSITIY